MSVTPDTKPALKPLRQPNWFSRLAHPGQFLVWSRYPDLAAR